MADLERQVELARELNGLLAENKKLLAELVELWAELPDEADVQPLLDAVRETRHCMQDISACYEELPSAEELDQLNQAVRSICPNA